MQDTEQTMNEPEETTVSDSVSTDTPVAEATVRSTTKLVKIKFRPAGRHYDFAVGSLQLTKGDRVIVETDRGRALGTVVDFPRQVEKKDLPDGLKSVLRPANADDLAMAASFNAKEEFSLRFCRERIAERKLDMKLVRAEYLFDGSKIIFYFTADGRIDFRELVKDLAHHFHTRIEMRQIGVRDEAKLIGGIGICGRELCCTSYLTEFAPVSVKMAKEQELALNPNKISGQCGRLLCCLAYEYETYCDMKKALPKCGRKVTVEGQEGEIISQHILRQTVTVNFGPQRRIEMTAEEIEKGIMPQRAGGATPASPDRAERPERSTPPPAAERQSEQRHGRDNRGQQRNRPQQGGAEGGRTPNASQQTKGQQPAAKPQSAKQHNRPTPAVPPEGKPAVKIQPQQVKQATAKPEASAAGQEGRRRRSRNRRRPNRKPGTNNTPNESGE